MERGARTERAALEAHLQLVARAAAEDALDRAAEEEGHACAERAERHLELARHLVLEHLRRRSTQEAR